MKRGRWLKAMILSLAGVMLVTAATVTTNPEPANQNTQTGYAASQNVNELLRDPAQQPNNGKSKTAQQIIPNPPNRIPDGVDTWHRWGFTGTGVKVGVLDGNFGGLLQEMDAAQLARIQGFCFTEDNDGDGELDVVTNSLTPCQETAPGRVGQPGHGTTVLKTIMLVAPDAQFYISNPPRDIQVRQAVDWMQKQPVEVINSSTGFPWDGPGDGTATADRPSQSPIIETATVAIAGGALWVNSAGNEQQSTWFKENPRFPGDYLDMQGDATSADDCNEVNLKEHDKPRFVMRWKDNWPISETAAGPDTDLVLELFEQDGDQLNPTDGTRDKRQNGASDQYPREIMTFKVAETGTHCVKVRLRSGETPDWVQFQEMSLNKPFGNRPNAGEGSIGNPGESTNPGLLTVGAIWLDATDTLNPLTQATSYGPLPEQGYPNGTIKPDLVADGQFFRGIETDEGTSFAAPRVAGMAALIRQALITNPRSAADYLRINAVRPAGASVNQWGYGSARLPVPEVPTNITITEDGLFENHIAIRYRRTPWDGPAIKHLVQIWQKPEGEGPPQLESDRFLSPVTIFARIPVNPGFTYFATVRVCHNNATIADECGPAGRSNDLTLLAPLEVPANLSANLRTTSVRLYWNAVDNADGYTAEQIGTDPINVTSTTTVFRDLTPGETYEFRVRAYRGSEPSDWSNTVSVTLPNPPEAPTITGSGLSNGQVQVAWTESDDADRYKVRQCDRQEGQWRLHPYTESGQTDPFTITTSGTTATIAGLTDGITYTFRVGAANDDGTTWSDTIDATAGNNPPPTPQRSPGGLTCPSEGMPPSMLTLTLSGTEVTLNWTAATFNDVQSQIVRRRTPGNDRWTDFTIGVNDTSWTDTSVVSGTSYIYRIQAKGAKTGENGRMSNRQVVSVP